MEAVRLDWSDQTLDCLILLHKKSELHFKEVQSHTSGIGLPVFKSASATYQLCKLGQIIKPFVPHFSHIKITIVS